MGISNNIQECYEFIFENYQWGDQIYLFGFSRGAFTARSLSGFLHLFGILPKSRRESIDDAYDIYKIRDKEKRKARADEFLSRHHTMRCEIKFLGVWDTVGALGLPVPIRFMDGWGPFKHEFHNTTLAENVKHGCHALSIDEERVAFHPTFWKENYLVEQVWFPGAHSDVGGGYPEQDLSDIALVLLCQLAMKYRIANLKVGNAKHSRVLVPSYRTARQLREFVVRAVQRMPAGEDRIKYDHLFSAGDPENKAFWSAAVSIAGDLENRYVAVED